MSRRLGVIGYPLKHSISAVFQQAALDHLRLDIRYEAWETTPEHLAERVGSLRHRGMLGASVTVPYKEAIMAYLDAIDPVAQTIGAVNLIVHPGEKVVGYNTDAGGFLRGLVTEGDFDPRGKAVVVLGAGGAARAIGFILIWAGISSLTIVNRTVERAQALARDLRRGPSLPEWTEGEPGISWAVYGEGVARLMRATQVRQKAVVEVLSPTDAALGQVVRASDLVVNCTSVGMKHSATEGKSPLVGEMLSAKAVAYDLVYNPLETPFLQQAKETGARVVTGLPMLIYQGAASFQMWTGQEAPLEVMMAAGRRALGVG